MTTNGSRVTDVLMVTTTVGMLHGVHGNTTNYGPIVALGLSSIISTTSLEDGLLNTSTTSNNSNHGTGESRNALLLARWHLQLSGIVSVANYSAVLTGGTSKRSTISKLFFDIANNSTLGHLTNGENVSNSKGGLLADIDELTGIHALGSNEILFVEFILVRIAEDYLGNGSTTARVMNNFLHKTAKITSALSKINRAVLGGANTMSGVGLEYRATTLTLSYTADVKIRQIKRDSFEAYHE
jgi:hypothetical protein